MASSFLRFLDHTQRRTTVGRTSLDEWSARRRDLYLTTHNTHNRQTSMPPVGFEPTISAGERPQIYALDGAATGTGNLYWYHFINYNDKENEPTTKFSRNMWTREGASITQSWNVRWTKSSWQNDLFAKHFKVLSTKRYQVILYSPN